MQEIEVWEDLPESIEKVKYVRIYPVTWSDGLTVPCMRVQLNACIQENTNDLNETNVTNSIDVSIQKDIVDSVLTSLNNGVQSTISGLDYLNKVEENKKIRK